MDHYLRSIVSNGANRRVPGCTLSYTVTSISSAGAMSIVSSERLYIVLK
jgi:hypothetical protein